MGERAGTTQGVNVPGLTEGDISEVHLLPRVGQRLRQIFVLLVRAAGPAAAGERDADVGRCSHSATRQSAGTAS